MPREINRLTILQRIFDIFQVGTQWPDQLSKHFFRAEALIELVEISDCGSIGGHDPKCPNERKTACPLFDRYLTLLRKDGSWDKIDSSCGASVTTLTAYYKNLYALRDDTYSDRRNK